MVRKLRREQKQKHKHGLLYHILEISFECLHLRKTLHSATDVNWIYSNHLTHHLLVETQVAIILMNVTLRRVDKHFLQPILESGNEMLEWSQP